MAELTVLETSETLTRVALAGRLDINGVEEVEVGLDAQAASRHRPTIVDISGVDFISSLGMGMLVRVAKSLGSHQVRMVLVGARGGVQTALLASSIDKVIPMAQDEARAREILADG